MFKTASIIILKEDGYTQEIHTFQCASLHFLFYFFHYDRNPVITVKIIAVFSANVLVGEKGTE